MKFIVIDGLDGSGKDTQVELLAKYYRVMIIAMAVNLDRPFWERVKLIILRPLFILDWMQSDPFANIVMMTVLMF